MKNQQFIRDRSGVTAVEFAMVVPVFITLMFGIVQLGLGFYNAATVQWVLDRATRKAVIDSTITQSQLQSFITTELNDLSKSTATLSYNVDNTGTFPIVQLGTTYTYTVKVPFVPDFDIHYNINTRVPVPQN